MGVETTAKFPDLTDKTMTKVFIDSWKTKAQEYKKLPLGIIPSTASYEKYSSRSTTARLPRFTGGSVQTLEAEQLYDKTITPFEYSGIKKLQRKLFDDNRFKDILDEVVDLGNAAREGKDIDVFAPFNEATSTTNFSGGDSKALVATDHPYSPTDSTTQSNKSTSALSATTLAANRVSMTKFVNAKGQPAGVDGSLLLVPVDLADTAEELTKSSAKVATSYSSGVVNVLNNISYVSSIRLSDTNNWFLIDPILAKRMFLLVNRIALEFAATDDFETMQKWYRAYERYNVGFIHYIWVMGAIVS